jgi:hypothetical protein
MNTQPQTWDYMENKYMEDWRGRHFQLLALVNAQVAAKNTL